MFGSWAGGPGNPRRFRDFAKETPCAPAWLANTTTAKQVANRSERRFQGKTQSMSSFMWNKSPTFLTFVRVPQHLLWRSVFGLLSCFQGCKPVRSRGVSSDFLQHLSAQRSPIDLCNGWAHLQHKKKLNTYIKQQPEGPLTEDPSTQESHPDHGRVFSRVKQPSRSSTSGETSSF